MTVVTPSTDTDSTDPDGTGLVARLLRLGRAHLPAVHFLVDGAIWVVAIPLSVWLRYDFDSEQVTPRLVVAIVLTVALQGLVG